MNANLFDENNNHIGYEFVEVDEHGVGEYPIERPGYVWCAMGNNEMGVPCFRLMEAG